MKVLSFFGLFVLLFYSQLAYAAKINNTASVEIVEPLSLLEESGFETLYLKGSETIQNNIVGVASTKKDIKKIIPPSEYLISGSKTDVIQIKVSPTATDSGVTLDNFVLKYNNNKVNAFRAVQPPPGRNAKLSLGATLNVKGGTKAGLHEPGFEVAIYYE